MESIITRYRDRPRVGLALVVAFLGLVSVGALLMERDQWATNHFRLLEVPRTATLAEVKRAYRRLSLEAHPDRFPPDEKPQAEARFILISKAHDVLSNDEQRDVYERWGDVGLEWLAKSQSVAVMGLVQTLVTVTTHFVTAFLASVYMSRTNARVWILGGLALVTAQVLAMSFGDGDVFVLSDRITRHDKIRVLWSLFPNYVTSVCAVMRVLGHSTEEMVAELCRIVYQQNDIMLRTMVEAHAAAKRDVAVGASKAVSATREMLERQAKEEQANKGKWQVPAWMWMVGVSVLLGWLSPGSSSQ